MKSRIRLVVAVSLGLAVAPIPTLRAQQPSQPPQNVDPLQTLHVYVDLIQVPVLVLDSELNRMKPIDPARFQVSLDSGPPFHPRSVRQEGDDPIALGILLDANGAADLMPEISSAISGLAPQLLRPQDHVTVFALDCNLMRTIHDAPANTDKLKAGVDDALASWRGTRKIQHPVGCTNPTQLWDAMLSVIEDLGNLPGRKVLLAVTNGQDGGSHTQSTQILSYAQIKGVAIFGYKPSKVFTDGRIGMPTATQQYGKPNSPAQTSPALEAAADRPLNAICRLSGGMVLSADSRNLKSQLAQFTTIVRERYILEFPRAHNDRPGEHTVVVSINKEPSAYISSAGVTVVMRDASVDRAPNTIPGTADAPELGKRKVPILPR